MTRAHPSFVVLATASLAAAALTASAYAVRGRAPQPSPSAVAAEPTTFLAFGRDFRDFRRWERHAVEGAMMPIGAPDGPTYVYLNRRAPERSQRWPVGTIVVKAIESGAPHQWTIHAMVKRGVPFNDDGAIGWEYFELAFEEGGEEPSIVWRGGGPPSGHGYAAAGRSADAGAVPLVCDDCHAAAWQNDSLLTPAIALRR